MRVPSGGMQQYQRSVDLGAMPSARVENGAMPAAYGANVAQAMGGMGEALGKMAAVQDKIQEDKVAADVVAAQTAYRKRLSDALYAGDNALLARKGENADKIDTEFADTERKIRQETMAGLPNFELAHKAFLRTADQETQQGTELVNRYRQQEGQRTFKLNLSNAFTTNAETTARNYNNPVAIQQGLETNATYAQTWAARFGAAEAQALQKEQDQQLVNKALESAWGKEDFGSMKTLLDQYGDKLGADQASKWQHSMTERQKANDQAALFSSLKNNPAFKDANGFFDPQKAMDYVRGLKKTVTVGGGGDKSYTWDQVKELVSGNESGGNYDAHNGDSGAHGKYQFMPGTWEGVMGDAPMTPQNQELAFDKKYKSIYDKYGAAGVLVAVYAGDDNAGRYMRGEKLLGEGGEYSADAPQYSGGNQYPSVRQYVMNALGSDGRGGGGAAQTREEPMYDEATLAQMERQFQTFHAEDIRKDNEKQNFALRNVQDWLATNKDLPLDQKTAFVSASGLRPAQVDAINTGMVKQVQAEQKAQMEQTSKIASGQLELLDARDALTTSSVEALANQLTPDAYLKYLAKATRAQKTDGEKVNSAVDKDWHALIKNDPVFGNADQQNALIGSITEILNVEHTDGYDRRVKAAKFIEEARDKGKRDSIAGYSTRNNQAFQQMEELYPGSSTLVRKGDPNVDGYEWMDILKRMAAQTYEDPAAAKAWNTIFTNRLPLTENSFAELTEFYRQEGAQ